MNDSNWELRPVKTPDGQIVIREVYYNHQAARCHIEMDVGVPYETNHKKCTEQLKLLYPDLEEFDRYNSKVITYNPDKDKLADWTLFPPPEEDIDE